MRIHAGTSLDRAGGADGFDENTAGFGGAEGDAVAADGELDRVAEGGETEQGDLFALGEAHLEESEGDGVVSLDGGDPGGLSAAEGSEGLHPSSIRVSRPSRRARAPRTRFAGRAGSRRAGGGAAAPGGASGRARRFVSPVPAAG